MADGQHKLSRRALLGAVCASSLVRHPGLDPGPMNIVVGELDPSVFMGSGLRRNDGVGADDAWDRALAGFEKAQAELDSAAHTEDEDLYDRLGARHDRATRKLLRTPAPNLHALAAKLDLALDERAGEFNGDSAEMKAIKSDARRLASADG